MSLRAFVTAPIMVSPPYVSFYGFEGQRASARVMVEAGLEKPLNLEVGDFTLHGKVAYTLQEVERGRKFRIIFNALPFPEGTYRGYLNLNTNYPEKPLLNIRIIGRFVKDEILGRVEKRLFSSFRRKPESSEVMQLESFWTPVFTGVTTSCDTVKDHGK